MNYHTIINVPLAPLRPLVSVRAWNLLTRTGFTDVAQVREAAADGALKDIRGLGPATLLEIRLALDSLPPDAPTSSSAQGPEQRQPSATVEDHVHPDVDALAQSMTPGNEQCICNDPAERYSACPVHLQGSPEPEPVDDEGFEGYVIDTRPKGLDNWSF